jgi:L-asparaginase
MAKTKVCVIYTGGTIGMAPSDPNNPDSPLVPAPKDRLEEYVPGLGEKEGIIWEIVGLVDENGKPVPPLDSSDVNAEHWIYMARAIEDRYQEYDGFVILHGTDTMAYTAAGLSFLLNNLAKPVVITGSQLPIAQVRTDAVQNFVNAVYVAGYKAMGLPCVPEVIICFGDVILRGNRTSKVSVSTWQGFDSPNYPKLGSIGEHIKINDDLILKPANNEESPFYVHSQMDPNVMDIGIFPGLNPKNLKRILSIPELKGIVLRTFGSGNAPGDPGLLEAIESAVGDKKVILNVTQCTEGMVEMGVYAASSGLLERGVISGLDMVPEAALAKMMSILATEPDKDEIQTQMQINQRGEQSQSLFDVRYGDSEGKDGGLYHLIIQKSAKPSGQFRKSKLVRGVLRISGAEFRGENLSGVQVVKVKMFINFPSASSQTSEKDPHFAGILEANYDSESGDKVALIKDITPTIKKIVDEGRPINITLIPTDGVEIRFNGLYLALFAKD